MDAVLYQVEHEHLMAIKTARFEAQLGCPKDHQPDLNVSTSEKIMDLRHTFDKLSSLESPLRFLLTKAHRLQNWCEGYNGKGLVTLAERQRYAL